MATNANQVMGAASAQPGNTEAAFRQFDAYPWVRDRSFLVRNRHMLINPQSTKPFTLKFAARC